MTPKPPPRHRNQRGSVLAGKHSEIQAELEAFRRKVQGTLNKTTVYQYISAVQEFLSFLAAEGKPLKEITPELFVRFRDETLNRGPSGTGEMPASKSQMILDRNALLPPDEIPGRNH